MGIWDLKIGRRPRGRARARLRLGGALAAVKARAGRQPWSSVKWSRAPLSIPGRSARLAAGAGVRTLPARRAPAAASRTCTGRSTTPFARPRPSRTRPYLGGVGAAAASVPRPRPIDSRAAGRHRRCTCSARSGYRGRVKGDRRARPAAGVPGERPRGCL